MALTVVPPPTPNGGLHLGHLSGPYLYADVHRRWQRQLGRASGLWLHTDNSQVYCVTAADKAGVPVDRFVADKAAQIRADLRAASIEVDGSSTEPPSEYASFVNAFFAKAFRSEHIFETRRSFFVDAQTGEPLADALISGTCPTCLSASSGGICEVCGTPNDPTELLEPHHATRDTAIETRDFLVTVIDLEAFAPKLRERFRSGTLVLRPRLRALLERTLSTALPTVPLTLPGRWGCPVDGRPDTVFNPWAELLPGAIFHSQALSGDSRWSRATGPDLFFGFDNSFFYTLLHSALQFALDGEYALPRSYTTNEFYELEHQKFSSGLGHAIWIPDAVSEFGADALRFHICATNPMYQRANFSPAQARRNIETHLVNPLRRLLRARDGLLSQPSTHVAQPLPLASFEAEAKTHYAPGVMDLQAAAHRAGALLRRLAKEAEDALQKGHGERLPGIDAGLALWSQLVMPLMPGVGARLKDALLGPDRDVYVPHQEIFGHTLRPTLSFAWLGGEDIRPLGEDQ